MPSINPQDQHDQHSDSEAEMLDPNEALEEYSDGGDVAMDSDNDDNEMVGEDQEEIQLENDSIAYFDAHKDSVYAIAQHPKYPSLIATGGGEGEEDDAPGKGYVVDTSAAPSRPVLPASYSGEEEGRRENTRLARVFEIDGHTDSINALAFTLPGGGFLLSGGLDGQLRVYSVAVSMNGGAEIGFVGSSQEVEEVNWVAACPGERGDDAFALGASDGSVWVYSLENGELRIVQTYFMHTGPCTAGAWTPDGKLLATVSEDGSLNVFDVWGVAGGKGLVGENGQTVVSLTSEDQRFAVEGGLYSVAVNPTGAYLACGGAGGAIKIVSLPRLSEAASAQPARRGAAGKSKGGQAESSTAGTILASLHTQADGVESLAFAPHPHQLLAAGSVDGSIGVYDCAKGFALRKLLRGAHEDFSVVKVEFVRAAPGAAAGWLLTSCGMDGVVRRWDLRGATAGAGADGRGALLKEWRGHRGDGEGGGVLGFVQGETGERIVTAGDDGVVLVFEA